MPKPRRHALAAYPEQQQPNPTIKSLAHEVWRLRLIVDDIREEFLDELQNVAIGQVPKSEYDQPKISTQFEEEAAIRDRQWKEQQSQGNHAATTSSSPVTIPNRQPQLFT